MPKGGCSKTPQSEDFSLSNDMVEKQTGKKVSVWATCLPLGMLLFEPGVFETVALFDMAGECPGHLPGDLHWCVGALPADGVGFISLWLQSFPETAVLTWTQIFGRFSFASSVCF